VDKKPENTGEIKVILTANISIIIINVKYIINTLILDFLHAIKKVL